jgi:hypothetical protein
MATLPERKALWLVGITIADVVMIAITILLVNVSRDASKEVFVGMGGVGEPFDTASVGQTIQRWQMEGGMEVAPDVFWATYPASSAAVIPIPTRLGVDLLYLNDPGEGKPIVYFQRNVSLSVAQALNYNRVAWHLRNGLLTLTARDRVWIPTAVFAIASGVICGTLAYSLTEIVLKKRKYGH